MTPTQEAAEREALAQRLRDACASVRSKSFPLSDLIPLMQQAADALSQQGGGTVAEPVAWRMRDTGFNRPTYRYYSTKEQAVADAERTAQSRDDGHLTELTALYAAPPAPQEPESSQKAVAIDYTELYGFAQSHALDYNVLCAVVRKAILAPQEAREPKHEHIEKLKSALTLLMEWQVKSVRVWHNRAYDNAAEVLASIDTETTAKGEPA